LALVLKGAAAPRLLDTYNEERLPNAKRLLQTTDRMFNLAAGTDWLVNLIRTTIFPPMAKFILSIDAVKKKFFPLVSQIGISYRDSSMSSHDTGGEDFEVKAGDRLPYFLLEGNSIFDKLRAPKFHLLAFSDGSDGANMDQQKQREEIDAKYQNRIDYYAVPLNPNVAEIFGTSKSFQVLLRPDNYIAYISADISPGLALNYLAGLAT
jgi:hypothetical protein